MPNGTAQTAMSSTSPGRAAAGHPALLGQQDGGDDAGDDAQRVGADRQRPEVPDALRGAGDGGEDHARTPLARSSRQRPDALGAPALQHLPHVGRADDDAVGERGDLGRLARRRRRRGPTQTARSGATARVRATSVSAASLTVARVPVTPMVEAA